MTGSRVVDVAAGLYRLYNFNADGTKAEKSGNGLRIFGAYLHGRCLATNVPFQGMITLQAPHRLSVAG